MKITPCILIALLLLLSLVACGSEENQNTSVPLQESTEENKGSEPSETSKTVAELFVGYNITEMPNGNSLVEPQGQSDKERDHYIIRENGEILKTISCQNIFKYNEKEGIYYVCTLEKGTYFINADGERFDNITWDYLFRLESESLEYLCNMQNINWTYVEMFGCRNDEYYILDDCMGILGKINTEPLLCEVYDGLTIAYAFNNYDYFYGVMKGSEYIIEPLFNEKPIIKKGVIIGNSNLLDTDSAEGYIYDYSGDVLKEIDGYYSAHQDFDYIIQCERNDQYSDDAMFSILDYSGKTLYSAPMGVSIDLVSDNPWGNGVEPYYVILNGEIVHLEKLIDGIEYPPVIIRDYANAKDISPEQLPIVQTPYLVGNTGRQYPVTDELKISVKEKLLEYLALENVTFNEKNLSYAENIDTFYAQYVNGDATVFAYCDSVCISMTKRPITDPMADPAVQTLCKLVFKNNEKLKIIPGSNGVLFTICEEKDTAYEMMLSMTKKNILVFSFNNDTLCVSATDRSDESIFPNYTFDAISYDEALKEFRKGSFINSPYSLLNFDYGNAKIEGAEFKYILATDCDCEECFDVGYYIPCYSFYVRDKESPEYYGYVYVPAIDINELNEYLKSISQPHINHYWTAE